MIFILSSFFFFFKYIEKEETTKKNIYVEYVTKKIHVSKQKNILILL